MCYLKKDSNLYDNYGNVVFNSDKYQTCQVLDEKGNYYLVNLDGSIGYIDKDNVRTLSGAFVVVDISSQQIYYYCDTDIAFTSGCTTGKDSSPTELGVYNPYGVANYHNFGPDHNYVESKYLWAPFNGGQGLHDAPWENSDKFGDPSYRKNHGSAGCVRLPDKTAQFLEEVLKKNTYYKIACQKYL
jgi:hypothetical protein